MTPQDLIAAFDDLAGSPDGVSRLRELVLELAVRGRLVEQDPEDEPAYAAYTRAQEDATWRVAGRMRNAKRVSVAAAPAGVAPLPLRWVECRLGDVVQLLNGRAYSKHELLDRGTPVIRIQNLNGGSNWFYSDLHLPPHQYCDEGDLLFAWSASFGPYLWSGPRSIYHYHIWKLNLSQAVLKRFAYYMLLHLTDAVRAQSHGLAMLHMTKAKMESWPLSLPPVAEQRRIVARVDELMALLDELEKAQDRRERTRVAARDSALDALRSAESPEEVEVAWGRFAERVDELASLPADIEALRSTVRQLAVRGQLLAPSNSAKTSQSVHRKAEGSLRDGPFALPSGWAWTALRTVAQLINGDRGPNYPARGVLVSEGIPFINAGDLRGGRVSLQEMRCVTESRFDLLRSGKVQDGDVLFCLRGSLGKAAVVRGLERGAIASSLIIVRPGDRVLSEYLLNFFESPLGASLVRLHDNGSAQPNLAGKSLAEFPVPLPPLDEQRRIVARVGELMDVLDRLEARLVSERSAQTAFAAAAVHHLDA